MSVRPYSIVVGAGFPRRPPPFLDFIHSRMGSDVNTLIFTICESRSIRVRVTTRHDVFISFTRTACEKMYSRRWKGLIKKINTFLSSRNYRCIRICSIIYTNLSINLIIEYYKNNCYLIFGGSLNKLPKSNPRVARNHCFRFGFRSDLVKRVGLFNSRLIRSKIKIILFHSVC